MKHPPQSCARSLARALRPQQRRKDIPCNGALRLRQIDQQRETLPQFQLDRAVVTLDLGQPESLK